MMLTSLLRQMIWKMYLLLYSLNVKHFPELLTISEPYKKTYQFE